MGAIAAKRGQKEKKSKTAVTASAMVAEPEQLRKDEGPHEAGTSSAVICANCGDSGRCRRRQFSEQAWTVLLLWNEISPSVVDKPICSDCYEELREILIERTDEVDEAMQRSDEVARIREQLGTLAS